MSRIFVLLLRVPRAVAPALVVVVPARMLVRLVSVVWALPAPLAPPQAGFLGLGPAAGLLVPAG